MRSQDNSILYTYSKEILERWSQPSQILTNREVKQSAIDRRGQNSIKSEMDVQLTL